MKNGKHLILDAYDCNKEILYDRRIIKEMLLNITKKIGLRPLSEPMLYDVTEDMLDKQSVGTTGVIIFMESHFTFHAFPEQNYFSADIYSCKGFKHLDVTRIISRTFEPQKLDVQILERGQRL